MNEATKQAILSAVRSVLIAIGGIVTTRGVLTEGQWQEIIGVVMVVVPLVWGIWDKYRAEEDAKKREVVAMNVGIRVADATVGATPPVTPDRVSELIAKRGP